MSITLIAYGEDSREAHLMRSDLLRLIEAGDTKDLPEGVDLLKSMTSVSKLTARMSLATRFLASTGDIVPKNVPGVDEEELNDELMAIFQIAASVCFNIHTQRNGYECEGIRDFPTTFSHDSPIMEAHGLHYKILSDDPTAMDGRRILLVTQPAVFAIGKADGSEYGGEPRILKKAIVWLG